MFISFSMKMESNHRQDSLASCLHFVGFREDSNPARVGPPRLCQRLCDTQLHCCSRGGGGGGGFRVLVTTEPLQ